MNTRENEKQTPILLESSSDQSELTPGLTNVRCFSVQALDRCTLHAAVYSCGKDVVVILSGGSLPHVGACALGTPDAQDPHDLQDPHDPGHASVSVLCASGHRDDEVARLFAKKLAGTLSCNVCVSAGIHIDDASPDELKAIVEACNQLLSEILG